jgi:shikimate kinase
MRACVRNGGSGKSWLSERLSRSLSVPAIDLDVIHWEAGGYMSCVKESRHREGTTGCRRPGLSH